MLTTGLRRGILFGAVSVLVTMASLSPSVATAQQDDDSHFRVTPYLWMLGLDGTTAVLGQDTDVDASFSDILDVLNIALSVNMEWNTKSGWFFVLDPMWAELETDYTTPGPIPAEGKVEIELIIADALIGYELENELGFYGGVRYYDQDIKITPNLLPTTISLGDDWSDFVLGARYRSPIGEKWAFAGKLDTAVGGDSDSAWYLQAAFMRKFGETMHLDLGWRYYDVDYESGAGPSKFKWDVAHSGPAVGFSWQF